MKLRQVGRAAWAGAVSVGLVLGMAACGRTNTIDYIYVANAKNAPGTIGVYLVDSESGVLTPNGTISSGGNNPVSLATTPNNLNLYALNHDDNTLVEFSIASDSTLTKKNTYTTPGNSPMSMKVNAAGTYLYVVDAFQSQYSATNPGPGAIVAYPIGSDGALGTPVSYPVCNNPVDVTVLNNGAALYVIDDPASQPPKVATTAVGYTASGSCAADTGQVSAFSIGSSGALTAVTGSPFAAGTSPSAIASDPTDRFVYVTDLVANELIAYSTESDGALAPINNGPFPTGSYPDAVTVDPRGLYVYVANYNSQSVSSYAIAQSTGAPASLSGTASTAVTAGPTALFIEPNAGKYLYATDFIDSSIYGESLNASTGALSALQNDPYNALGSPTAIAGIVHGPHPTEVLPQY